MAHPKRKISKTRRDKRRTHHKIDAVAVATCPTCGNAHRYHHVCMSCGTYRGRKVLDTGVTTA